MSKCLQKESSLSSKRESYIVPDRLQNNHF